MPWQDHRKITQMEINFLLSAAMPRMPVVVVDSEIKRYRIYFSICHLVASSSLGGMCGGGGQNLSIVCRRILIVSCLSCLLSAKGRKVGSRQRVMVVEQGRTGSRLVRGCRI